MLAAEVLRPGGRIPTVLVVEDEFLVRAAVSDELRSAGFMVFEANDCAEALEVLAAHPEVDLLFTDIGLPGPRDGNYLLRVARAEYPRLKVIAATAYSAYRPVEGLLRKPYGPAEAVTLVRTLISARPQHQDGSA
jgi:CheY-like chemotaxis protein